MELSIIHRMKNLTFSPADTDLLSWDANYLCAARLQRFSKEFRNEYGPDAAQRVEGLGR